MIVAKNNYFYINTQNTSYIIRILPDGTLNHIYYGRKIKGENMDWYNLYTSLDYTCPVKVGKDITTPDALPQEYPSFGRGDYRTPACVISDSRGRQINKFMYVSHEIFSGTAALKGLPSFDKNTEDVQTLKIVVTDSVTNAEVHLFYSAFFDSDIIARHTEIHNKTYETLEIKSVMSFSVDFEATDFDMISLYGRWANERTPQRFKLPFGESRVTSNKGASGHGSCPFIALARKDTTEEHGECYGFSLVYSGSFEMNAQVGQFANTRVSGGILREGFSWQLKTGESFTAPQCVMTYSYNGLGQMSRNFHKGCRKHLGACSENRKHPVVLNLWEAFYFDVNSQKVLESIDAIGDLGVDTCVLDDGWFGKRVDDSGSLGDWYINSDKFPNGFEDIINACKQKGLSFGLWFEPEAISPDSEIFRAHPDWCIHLEGLKPAESRNECLLDYSRQEVVQGVYEYISKILKKYDISYVKWDMNRNITDNGSAWLGADRQGEHAHRYILGVYGLMERLAKEFPQVFFEGSAGGGGRFDFGILYYMSQIWTSDNTDAIGRLKIQYGTSMVFPPETISAHVSDCPNHQTGRSTPFKTRADVAQLFSFGYELDPKKLPEDIKKQVREQISQHRDLEEWLPYSLFYRIKSPLEGEECAWSAVSQDKSRSAVLYVTRLTTPRKQGEYLRLIGLEPHKRYRVCPLNIETTGETLMNAGIPIKEQFEDFTSILFTISEV